MADTIPELLRKDSKQTSEDNPSLQRSLRGKCRTHSTNPFPPLLWSFPRI